MTSVIYPERCDRVVDLILDRLARGLDPSLFYHSIAHTKDVMQSAERLGGNCGLNESELELLKVAAAFHDSGFLLGYANHEKKGCELVQDLCPGFGYSAEEVNIICDMIMATKIPQSPESLLQQVLCDADLDYLGREDFGPISRSLFKEFLHYDVVKNEAEWMRLQVSFFEAHQYWTSCANENRAPAKAERLKELKAVIA